MPPKEDTHTSLHRLCLSVLWGVGHNDDESSQERLPGGDEL